MEICEALEHAHGRGLIHRDVKPGNVWLTPEGHAKLGDFGLAIALDRSRLTQQPTLVGTTAYMPPEQILGTSVDARADLCAFGAMLYELLTSRPPFLGEDFKSLVAQHLRTGPVAPSRRNSEVTPALDDLILRLLARSLDDRPASAADVKKSLSLLL